MNDFVMFYIKRQHGYIRPTQEMRERGGMDAPAQHLQGVACQSEQCIHIAVVKVGEQLLGFLLHHFHQILLLLPPEQGRGGANASRREQGVSGEEVAL